jgi:ABC-2 type transport system ATP-binding protein
VLTTHYLDEADQLAERVIVIDHGRLIADDTPARLKADYAGDRISLSFDHDHDARRAAERAAGIAEGARIDQAGSNVVIQAAGGIRLVPKLLRSREEGGVTVTGVEVARPTLDDVFLNLTGRSLREESATSQKEHAA